VGPTRVGIGSAVEKKSCGCKCVGPDRLDRQPGVGEPQKGCPSIKRTAVVGQRRILVKESAHRVYVVRYYSGVDAVAYYLRMACQDAGRNGATLGPITLIVPPLPGERADAIAVHGLFQEETHALV